MICWQGSQGYLRGNFRREVQDANFKGIFEKHFGKAILKVNFERELWRQFGWGNRSAGDGGTAGAGEQTATLDIE